MTRENDLYVDKCMEVFFPYHSECISKVEKNKTNFVHYTTAEAAMNMLQTNKIWMRQPYFMNDYQEIEHGLKCLILSYNNEDLNFKKLLNSYHSNISIEIEKEFDSLLRANREDVYLFCVSEHLESENKFGRLSMWRAYGKDVGVAIVMRNETFLTESPGIKAQLLPVAYQSDKEFFLNFQQIEKNIKNNDEFIKAIPREQFKDLIVQMFRFLVLSTKHSGFTEEKEWRVVYSPGVDKSAFIEHDIEKINGIPQEVCKLPLRNDEINGLNKISPNDLIEHIIIGPTHYPLPIYKAFVKLLDKAGVENASSKVLISDIPLRI